MVRPEPQVRDALLSYLRQNYPSICRHWFDDIEPLEIASGTLRLLVRETVQLRYLQRSCMRPFTEAAQAATGRLLAVQFVGEADLADDSPPPPSRNGAAHSEAEEPVRLPADDDMVISPDYSFDTFVVGPGNRLAHAAAIAVTKKPGKAYNPLFVHGGVGLGKTHLLHAICQAAMRSDPDLHIYYTSCNGFMHQFMNAVQAGVMSDFRHRFRNVDLLVIDDIHDLSKRDRTQEEFFHTFNSLYQAGRQIVISSDAPPSETPDLEERLVSRFNCGLVARIERPCYETRVEIVRQKARMRGVEIADDVANYVAARIDSNIRELEGAISTLQNIAHVNQVPITLDLAKQAIGDQAAAHGSQHPTVQSIIDAVSGYYDVKLTDLLSKRRHKSIALPRQVGMYLARKHTRYSLEEIGGYFGGRDHTTVMHAIRTIKIKREADTVLDHDVNRLEEHLSESGTHAAPDRAAAASA